MIGNLTIAVDGPSGAGKSTVAKLIAKELNILYLDTGAMYRAFALKALRTGKDPENAEQAESILQGTDITVSHSEEGMQIYLDGEDVSLKIREHALSKAASDISKHIAVRKKLVEEQQKIAGGIDVIMDGRDIGSFVLPNATVKFYLDATAEERARRRCLELKSKGQDVPYEKVLDDINARDYNDKNRPYAPLVRVADAIYVDCSDMSIDEVVRYMISVIAERTNG